MMNFTDALPGWEENFHDYGMTLFCANRIKDFSLFKTELRQLLKVIPCKDNRDELKKLLKSDEYKCLERETAEAIAVLTDNNLLLKQMDKYEENGGYNMCKGLDNWAKEEQDKGRTEGRVDLIRTALASGSSPEEIARVMNIDLEEILKIKI